ncbi:unnamed protein product [Pieris brassicae]|uniref:Peptidase S1 domain-containing protein n=1 Tax=Pieris brassicae TaxID=7116 RepID=A0A9P0X4A0_PIEBR|nr:unnamed protein product [Pieris brassicae]
MNTRKQCAATELMRALDFRRDAICHNPVAVSSRRSSPDKLQYLYVKTLTGDQCSKKINNGRNVVNLSSSQMCTFNRRGEGTCQGDSGCSLVCNGASAGVVSFNFTCARDIPDVYANTYKYNSWIQENTKSIVNYKLLLISSQK